MSQDLSLKTMLLFFIHINKLLYSLGRCTRYSDRLHDFSVSIPRFYKDVIVSRRYVSLAFQTIPLFLGLSKLLPLMNAKIFEKQVMGQSDAFKLLQVKL